MERVYHRFSYEALSKVVRTEVLCHDAVIEGGIGNNTARYLYFRDHGYTGLYIGVDPDQKSTAMLPGMIREHGNCFDLEQLQALCSRYEIADPIFLTNSALYLLIPRDRNQVADAVATLTMVFGEQLHIRPAGNFPLTASTLCNHKAGTDEGIDSIRIFLEESRKRGWNESVPGKNILLLKRNQEAYTIPGETL